MNNKNEFAKENVFGLGEANTAYAKYFIGNSYLNPLTNTKECPLFLANVTFEAGVVITGIFTRQQMAELFDSSRTNIIEHINNIYSSKELDKNSTCQDFRQVRKEGNRNVSRNMPFYNLDMIISVGYRVNSKRGIVFR